MIQAIIITSLCIGILLLCSTIRYQGREFITIVALVGIMVIHSAHQIFHEAEFRDPEFPLLTNAGFGVLFVALVIVFRLIFIEKAKRLWMHLAIGATGVSLFAFLYYSFFIDRAMPVLSFANLIWLLEVVMLITLTQSIWSLSFRPEVRGSFVASNTIRFMKIILAILLTPYIVSLTVALFPSDNFIWPYRPIFSTQWVTYAITILLLVHLFVRVAGFKKQLVTKQIGKFNRDVKDLAF